MKPEQLRNGALIEPEWPRTGVDCRGQSVKIVFLLSDFRGVFVCMEGDELSDTESTGPGAATRKANPRILLVHNLRMPLDSFVEKDSFVGQDLRLLQKHYDVIQYHYKPDTAGMKYVQWLARNRNRYDLCYVWFGGQHATIAVLLSKILRKKTIIIVGGYDTTYIPEIKYGFLSTPMRFLYAWFHFSLANYVIPVAESLKDNIVKNVKAGGKNTITVPVCHDTEFWRCSTGKSDDIALTVAFVNNTAIARLKGITTLIEAARLLPEIRFEIIGVQEPAFTELSKISPKNVTILPLMDKKELRTHYCRAKVYLQLSMSEGLGNALCEAMLCGCVPVGTRAGGIPTGIGDTGFYVPYGDEKATAEAVRKAMSSGNGTLARERIKGMFPLEMRERKIVELIEKLYD